MIDTAEITYLDAARDGDRDAFGALTEPHRRALLLHCYRMLGSLQDAEDLVQETLLRAWQRLGSFEGRGALRSWLYAIATNCCLNALDRRRHLPIESHPPTTPDAPPIVASVEEHWLDPFPDRLLISVEADPEARYTLHESVTLAFLTALQRLPPRQRAVLLLREVLAWHADEVAQLLNLSVPTVNGLLHRARATLARHRAAGAISSDLPVRGDATTQRLLDRYVRVWESADIAGLLALLTDEATLAMPPSSAWYSGRADIEAFITRYLFGTDTAALASGSPQGRWRLRPTWANGLPAFGVYERDPVGNIYQALGLSLIVPEGEQIAVIISFLQPSLLPFFDLPLTEIA